jgi:hypothetical protein
MTQHGVEEVDDQGLIGLFVGDLDAAHAIAQQLPQLVLEHPAKTTNTQNQYLMMAKKNRSREGSE